MDIIPTVGRVMLFYPDASFASNNFTQPVPGQPLAAIVAAVLADKLVNLTVFDAGGFPHPRRHVMVVQEDESPPVNGNYVCWMDYQIGQAKKGEAAITAVVDTLLEQDELRNAALEFAIRAHPGTGHWTITQSAEAYMKFLAGQADNNSAPPVDNAHVAPGFEQFSAALTAAAEPVQTTTFADFVQHGRDQGVPIVNGMPWSFTYKGHAVTHENDQCYLIMVPDGKGTTLRFTPDYVLNTMESGAMYLWKLATTSPLPIRTKTA